MTDREILRVTIVSRALTLFLPVALSILILILSVVLVSLVPPAEGTAIGSLAAVPIVAIPIGVMFLLPAVMRRKFSTLSPEVLAEGKSTLRIPWTEVVQAQVSHRLIKIRTKRGDFKMLARESDAQAIVALIRLKIGARLTKIR